MGHKLKKIGLFSRFSVPKASMFVGVFALAGVALLLATHAATPVNNAFEAEDGALSGNVTKGTDANASGGNYVSFFAAPLSCPTGQTGTPPNCTPLGANVGQDTSCIFASAPAGTQAAFCDGFNQATVNPATSRSGDMNGVIWGVSRASGSRVWQNYDSFDHAVEWENGVSAVPQTSNGGALCGQQGIFAPPNDLKICNGQLQDGTANVPGGDVTSIAMYPKQPFDFTGRTGTAVFDVSNDSEGGHDVWPEFWLTDKPVPDPFQHQTSWVSAPKSGFGIDFSASCDNRGGCLPNCQSAGSNQYPVSIGLVETYNNYVKTDISSSIQYDPGHCIIEPPRPGTGQFMNHFEIRFSLNQVDVYGTDAAAPSTMTATWIKANLKHMATIPIASPGMPLTKGLIWIEDDRYNPQKAREDATHVYHRFIWDNVGFDGPDTYRDLAYDIPNVASPNGATSFDPNYLVDPGKSVSLTISGVNKGTADKGSACTAAVPCALLTLNYQSYGNRPSTVDFTLNNHAYSYALPFNDSLDAATGLDAQFYSSTPRTLAIPITISDVVAGDNVLKLTNPTGSTLAYRNIDLVMVNAAPVP